MSPWNIDFPDNPGFPTKLWLFPKLEKMTTHNVGHCLCRKWLAVTQIPAQWRWTCRSGIDPCWWHPCQPCQWPRWEVARLSLSISKVAQCRICWNPTSAGRCQEARKFWRCKPQFQSQMTGSRSSFLSTFGHTSTQLEKVSCFCLAGSINWKKSAVCLHCSGQRSWKSQLSACLRLRNWKKSAVCWISWFGHGPFVKNQLFVYCQLNRVLTCVPHLDQTN